MNKFLRRLDLVRSARLAALAALAACAHHAAQPPAPQPTAPLPVDGMAGRDVGLFPLTLVAAQDGFAWDSLLGERRAALDRADSIITTLLAARAPEVIWVGPAALRRAARRSPGVVTDPDQMATAMLRDPNMTDLVDPLWAQLRTLEAIAGGRYALIPAALLFVPASAVPGAAAAPPAAPPRAGAAPAGVAELSIALVDVRLGKVLWRTVARGEGGDPWTALERAVKALTPVQR